MTRKPNTPSQRRSAPHLERQRSMKEEMDIRKPARRIGRVLGAGLMVGGCILMASAIFAGPHAFALGWKAVITQGIVGVACIIAGVVELWRTTKPGDQGKK